jgi:hypothetical protein
MIGGRWRQVWIWAEADWRRIDSGWPAGAIYLGGVGWVVVGPDADGPTPPGTMGWGPVAR